MSQALPYPRNIITSITPGMPDVTSITLSQEHHHKHYPRNARCHKHYLTPGTSSQALPQECQMSQALSYPRNIITSITPGMPDVTSITLSQEHHHKHYPRNARCHKHYLTPGTSSQALPQECQMSQALPYPRNIITSITSGTSITLPQEHHHKHYLRNASH